MHDLLDRYSRRIWEEAGRRGDDRARLVSILLRKRALSSAGSLAASVERRLALLCDRRSDDPWQLALPLAATQDEDPLEDDAPSAALAAPGLADPKRERRWLAAIAEAARTRRRRRAQDRVPAAAPLEDPRTGDRLHRVPRHARAARSNASPPPGIRPAVLHGGMTPADRSRVQHAFNERGGTLLATDAASEGLNLHHRCRVVMHYELPWNPSRLEQRAGRVDRLGQTRRVHELALVAAHTAERLVIAPLLSRCSWSQDARRGRMLDRLTESRVAAAVMTNCEPARAVIGEPDAMPVVRRGVAGRSRRLTPCERRHDSSTREASPHVRAVASELEAGVRTAVSSARGSDTPVSRAVPRVRARARRRRRLTPACRALPGPGRS